MFLLREKHVKHICLIVFVLIQLMGSKTVQGLECIQCDGTCKEDLTDTPQLCAGNDTFTKCYTKMDNDKIIRGCLSSKEVSTCTLDNHCVPSEGSKNNQLVCKACSRTDPDCSQTDVTDSKYSKICATDIKNCITKINDKLVERGCASDADIANCKDNNTCTTCPKVNCNTGTFPSGRLNCYQCSGDKCNDVATNSINSITCLIYQDKDECYTKGDSDTTMTRGCKSDLKENKCSTAAEGCVFCTDSGCNKLKYKDKPTLKCYQCTGDATHAECYEKQPAANLKSCVQEVLYNQDQYCYTQLEDDKIQRGCLNDNTALTPDKCKDTEGGACNKCTGEGCNGNEMEFTCIRCRSDENPDCWNNAHKLNGTKCRGHGNRSQGCFEGIWGQNAIRGCMVDASPQTQALCNITNNANHCKICHTENCNTDKSAGAKRDLSLALISVVLIQVVLRNFK